MSYDLDFWKYKKDIYLDNQAVYEKCSDGEIVEGLEHLPLSDILADLNIEFEGWRTDDENYENPKGKGAFEVFTTSQFMRFDCYGMQGEDMNRIIDVMSRYNCPLYDPQVQERYDE